MFLSSLEHAKALFKSQFVNQSSQL